MIVLYTLGTTAIRVGGRNVLPSATQAFSALFFLAVERRRQVPRRELQSLLFPGQADRSASHNLRQLLYRIRGLGAPLATTNDTIGLPAAECVTTTRRSLKGSR